MDSKEKQQSCHHHRITPECPECKAQQPEGFPPTARLDISLPVVGTLHSVGGPGSGMFAAGPPREQQPEACAAREYVASVECGGCGYEIGATPPADAMPCPCDGLRAENERLKQGIRSQAIAGTRHWFYAPCSACGAIEGMGLSSRGSQTTAVWCCYCSHFGPVIQGVSEDADRAAVTAWNQEFAQAFAERDALRSELVKLKAYVNVAEQSGCAFFDCGAGAGMSLPMSEELAGAVEMLQQATERERELMEALAEARDAIKYMTHEAAQREALPRIDAALKQWR